MMASSAMAAETEYLYGDDNDNVLIGSDAEKRYIVRPKSGADDIRLPNNGQFHWVQYNDVSNQGGVDINLTSGFHGGPAAGDTYENVRAFKGTREDDTFKGDGQSNFFDGYQGNDEFIDTYRNDTYKGGDGTDSVRFWKDYGDVTLTHNGNTITVTDATGYTDTLVSIEKVVFDDGVFENGIFVSDQSCSVPNSPPVLPLETYTVDEDYEHSLDVLQSATDPDNDALNIVSVSGAAHGGASIQNNVIIYSPDLNYSGDDSIQYTVDDGCGHQVTQTVLITVEPNCSVINGAPVLPRETYTVDEDYEQSLDVLLNATDPDNDYLRVVSVSGAAHGGTSIENNMILYSPDLDYNGTDSIQYTVNDGCGNQSTQSASITVKSDVNEGAKHMYFTMQAGNVYGNSQHSNMVTVYMTDPKVSLKWQQPTKLENGQCIEEGSRVTNYTLNFGTAQGAYTYKTIWDLESSHVDCSPTGSRDETCDVDILECSEDDYYVEDFYILQ